MPPGTLEVPGLCHSGWEAGGLLVGQGQQHMESPHTQADSQPSRSGGLCSGWDPGTSHRGRLHMLRLRRLLGAFSLSGPQIQFSSSHQFTVGRLSF